MPWATPNTYVDGQIMRASHFNQDLRDNFNYLNAERELDFVHFPQGTTAITSTSTSTVVITGTSLSLTVTSGRVMLWLIGVFSVSGGNLSVAIYQDGGSLNAILTSATTITTSLGAFMHHRYVTGLSNGNHTFDVRWNVSAGTATLSMDETPFSFVVMEI